MIVYVLAFAFSLTLLVTSDALTPVAPPAISVPTPPPAATSTPDTTPSPIATPQASPSPQPSASPLPSVSPLPGTSALPIPSPPATPTVSPVPSPTATPVYKYKVVPKASASPAADVPQILEVDLNDSHLQAHGHIQMRVLTSPDVVKVISRSNGHEGTLTQAAPGEFLGSGNVPGIPFIAKGWKVNLEFIATNAEGKNVSVKVPVTLD